MTAMSEINDEKSHRTFMMVTDLILPAMLLAIFPFVMPIYYITIPLFVVAMIIHARRECMEKSNKTITRRLYSVNATTTRAYDFDRYCTLSISQLFHKFDLPQLTSNDSTIIFSTALNYEFCIKIDGVFYSSHRSAINRAVCFSRNFRHVWVEEINISSFSKHSVRVTVPSVYSHGKKIWKRKFVNHIINTTEYVNLSYVNMYKYQPLTKKQTYNFDYWQNDDRIRTYVFGVSFNMNCTKEIPLDYPLIRIEKDTNCLEYVSNILGMNNIDGFDPTCQDNMEDFFRYYRHYSKLAFGFRNTENYTIVGTTPNPECIIFFEQNVEEPEKGHVFLSFNKLELEENTSELYVPWLHLDGRPRPRRKVAGRLGPAMINAKQPLYSNLEDRAIAHQVLEDDIDAINLQAELIEAQQNLNTIQNPPPPPGPIISINYTCPNFSYKTIYADGKILLLLPFLLATICRFGFPLIYWSQSLDGFIVRLFTVILLIIITLLLLTVHYYNHYTTLHIVSNTLNMSNVEYRNLIYFDILFGFAGVLYSITNNSLRLTLRKRILLQLGCLILLSCEMFIDFYISFIFFRLFTLGLYVTIYLLEGNSSLRFAINPTGVTVDVDFQDDMRPDVFQVNKFKYQRRVVEVRIDAYTQKYYLYTHKFQREMVDLEVFAQLLNAHFDRYNNDFKDISERMTRFIATCTTINRRKDITDRFPSIDQQTVAFALHYIKFSRSKSALRRLAAQTLNL